MKTIIIKILKALLKTLEESQTKTPKKPNQRIIFYPRQTKDQLTKSFKAEEFYCKCGKCGIQRVDMVLVEKLQNLRDRLGSKVIINSGFRCHEHNRNVGGVLSSQHLNGCAADIWCKNLKKALKIAESLGFRGIGVYKDFLHLDNREGVVARWQNK